MSAPVRSLCFNFSVEENLHGLIEQPVLHHGGDLLAAALVIALQTKETCSISFVDRYLHVTRAVEKNQLLTLRNVGIGAADPFNHLIPFEYNFKAPSFALLLELLLCDIHDHILEIIDEDDLAFDPVFAQSGT